MIRLKQILLYFCFISCVEPSLADEIIRIMAANTTSGNNQSYDPGEGNRIFQGLDPDIVLVQEMNVGTSPNKNTAATYRAWVDANFGTTFSYFVESGKNIPNGIVSRYPIISSGVWEDRQMPDREFVYARLNIPGDKDLWAVSVHLSSGGGSGTRNTQATALRDYISENIPSGDYLVVGGDFNTDNRTESCLRTLASTIVTDSPYPVDQQNNGNTNSSRAKPYDWVIPDADLNAVKTPLVVGENTFPDGLVLDSRRYTPLADIAPVRSGDSGVAGMQHMAVIRAFLIPSNDPPSIAVAADSTSTERVVDPDQSVFEIVRRTTVGLTVTGSDDGGEPALIYTWSLGQTTGAAPTFSVNGTNAAKSTTATFQAIGNYTFIVTVRDAAGLSVTSSVRVRVVQDATGLTVTPASTSLAVNATRAFSASLLDQFSQPMVNQPSSFSWSSTGGGSLNVSGLFSATTAGGPFSVTASGGGFSRSATVTVTRAFATIQLGNLSQVYDGASKSVSAISTPTGLALSILYNGSNTLPVHAGSYPIAATITDANYQGSANGTMVITPDPWALWRNTEFTVAEREAGLAADASDPDADGLANLIEYALGTNPRAFTAPITAVLNSSNLSLTFTRPSGLPGIRYAAEVSADLLNWSDVPLVVESSGIMETVRAEATGNQLGRFLRLRIERE